jgi:YD repeat-containing protein
MFDENLYQETISALHASEDTLSEVMNMTHKTKRRGRLRTTAVLAAVIAILCCMAAAAAALGLDQRLAEYFGATAEQEEFLSTAAVPMNIVKRDSGAVMRIEQVIADRYCAAVLIDFTAPEGTVLDQDYYAFDRSVSATSRDGVKMQTYGGIKTVDQKFFTKKVSKNEIFNKTYRGKYYELLQMW